MNNKATFIERVTQIAKGAIFPIGAIALFLGVSMLYFLPQYQDKALVQHDVVQYQGMCHDIMENREATGEDAQWTGNMFGGMPATLINIEYPSQMVKSYVGGVVNWVENPTAFIFFAMVAMWITTLLFGMKRWVGVIAALAYGLSTYTILIIGAGHITKIWAMVYAPMMLGAVYYTLRRNMWIGAALTALFTSLEIGANHPQITYYFAVAMAALWISEGVYAIKERRIVDWLKRTALLIVAGLFAIGSNFSPLWQTLQHQKETTRGGSELATAEGEDKGLDLEYMTRWSYGKAESFNMLVPNYMGGSSSHDYKDNPEVQAEIEKAGFYGWSQYYGEQPGTAGPTYLGAAVILLALLGIIVLPNRHKWWIVATCGIALLFAWGNNIMWLTELLYKYLPLYDKFRVPATALVVLQWAVPLLAAGAVAYIIKNHDTEQKRLRRALYWATGIVGGILLIFAAAGPIFHDAGRENTQELITKQFGAELEAQIPDSFYDTLTEAREQALQADALRSLIFVILTAAIVWLYIQRKQDKAIGKYILCASLALLITADLFAVDKRYLAEKEFKPVQDTTIQPTAADRYIMQNNSDGARVLNITVSPFNDATTSYFHRSIGGYHGAKLSRYQDLITYQLGPIEQSLLYCSDEEFYDNLYEAIYNPVLNMLNVKYIIAGPEAEHVVERENPLGNAWFVDSVYRVENASEEMIVLLDPRFDPETMVVVGEKYAPEKDFYHATGEVKLTKYQPNNLVYTASSTGGDGLVVFSEIFTEQGWTVKIDGKEAEPLRVNYVLRAVEVPEGEHTIEWSYRAPNWEATEGVSFSFSLIILLSCVAALIYYIISHERRQENKA